jgi:restriction system protein
MGSIILGPQRLADSLGETTGYKVGLALSVDDMCDLLTDSGYSDTIQLSESQGIVIRSEEYEDLFYTLLHRIGFTEEKYDGDDIGVKLYHKYKGTDLEEVHLDVLRIFNEEWQKAIEMTLAKGSKSLDPSPMMKAAAEKYGKTGLDMVMERLEVLDKSLKLRPDYFHRYTEWSDIEHLQSLFKGSYKKPVLGEFIDQRFINYLQTNKNKLAEIHWRKFEELTAEYFHKNGFNVELGPGRNDDGVDVRVWKATQNSEQESPHCIIQCKRQKKKIEKVVIKGLYADIEFQGADHGLIVTSSELSPGAKETISVRGYPILEINKENLGKWLDTLRTPGTGIVRV